MEKDVQQPTAGSDEPKQETPKGYEIPMPAKEQVMGFFKKVAGARKRP
jgi:hypothetical protein